MKIFNQKKLIFMLFSHFYACQRLFSWHISFHAMI